MSEVTIMVDLPGRRMQFSQDDILTGHPETDRQRAVRLLENVTADARASLSIEYTEDEQ